MNEIEITCSCQSITIADQGLFLVRGQVAHVPASSPDLAAAARVGAVRTRDVRRAQEVRPAPATEPRRVLSYVRMESATESLPDPTPVMPRADPVGIMPSAAPTKARRNRKGTTT